MLISTLMATKKTTKTGKRSKTAISDPAPRPQKKIGRPRAKHSDPNYVQMSIYIHKEVRSKVKVRLLENDGEFSGLVESLLRGWLQVL